MTGRVLFTLFTLSTLGAGCKQQLLCQQLASCGGPMPVGDWVLGAGHSSCSEDLYLAPPDPRLVFADLPAARTPPPEPALFDWCLLLATGPGDIIAKAPLFYFDSGPIGAATVHYAADGTYGVSTVRTGTYTLDFPSFCMRAFGATDGKPAEPNGPPVNVCKQLQVSLTQKAGKAYFLRKYFNINCELDPADPPHQEGCLCTFDASVIEESRGRYIMGSDATMFHLSARNFPDNANFCSQGDRLQLTGTGGEYLFDRPGLRTLDLTKITVNCTDHVQGPGEDGVDCGAACPVSCFSIDCTDMVKGPGEDGIDCGPNCPSACP